MGEAGWRACCHSLWAGSWASHHSCSMDSKVLSGFENLAQEASWCRVLQRGIVHVSLPGHAWNWVLVWLQHWPHGQGHRHQPLTGLGSLRGLSSTFWECCWGTGCLLLAFTVSSAFSLWLQSNRSVSAMVKIGKAYYLKVVPLRLYLEFKQSCAHARFDCSHRSACVP